MTFEDGRFSETRRHWSASCAGFDASPSPGRRHNPGASPSAFLTSESGVAMSLLRLRSRALESTQRVCTATDPNVF